MLVVFDLDGTLADDRHRLHLLPPAPSPRQSDYDAYYERCDLDAPVWPAIYALRAHLRQGDEVEIWTGRTEAVRRKTELWLGAHQVPALSLRRMRAPEHGGMNNVELKRGWLGERRPDLAYEDRPEVAEMFRAHGVVCMLVRLPGAQYVG